VTDPLIEGARVVDGTGVPRFRGAVAVEDGYGCIRTVTRHRDHGLDADTVIAADGSAVRPGFVDTHSHSDLELFTDPTLEPKPRQGVTAEVIGQDGSPTRPRPT